ncbi:FG-GAP repeat protein [Candidatus Fermentibacteria bacterium]|nr:FG-GAP repeat protein [Candidatus Fermentibacteria bacterium]
MHPFRSVLRAGVLCALAGTATAQPTLTLVSPEPQADSYFSASVCAIGDITGDGGADLLVGASDQTAGAEASGAVYLFEGVTGDPFFTFHSAGPETWGNFGRSVDALPDANGDGYDDFIVGAWREDGAGISDAGRVYVFDGDLDAPDYTLVSPNPEVSGRFAWSAGLAGDVNNDGAPDIIVGAYIEDGGATNSGRAYVFDAQTGTLLWTFVSPNPEVTGRFGDSVSGAGDVDDDGYDDVIIGAGSEDGGTFDAGRAYVFSGQTGGLIYTFVSPNANITGFFGVAVDGVGDVDNDGYDDVIVGTQELVSGLQSAGRAYVFSGQTGALLHTLVSPSPEEWGFFGSDVLGIDDMNSDGRPDIIVSAAGEDGGATDAGRVYAFSGIDGSLLRIYMSPNSEEGGAFGVSIARVPDSNSDGCPELLVGASYEDGGATDAGRVYLLSGSDGSLLQTFVSPNAKEGGEFGVAVSAIGDLNGDGVSDALVGGFWEDGGATESGTAYLFSGSDASLIQAIGSPSPESPGFFGGVLFSVGDATADGMDDFVIGASYEDGGGVLNAGKVYFFSGDLGAPRLTLVSPNAQSNGRFGCAVAHAGDVDDDGDPDLVVGAYGETVSGQPAAGRAYVFDAGTGTLLRTLVTPDPTWAGRFAWSVAGAGDVDNDGFDDVIIGADSEYGGAGGAGIAYVFSGQTGGILHTLTSPNAASGGSFGTCVSSAGDVNHDGHADVTVGSTENHDGYSSSGRAYVFDGQTGGSLYTLVSPNPGDWGFFGASLANAGDVDNDTYDDIIAGASGENGGQTESGRVYLFSGATGTLMASLVSPTPEEYGHFGAAVAGIGDRDGDGFDDLLIGALYEDGGAAGSGKAYVFSGTVVPVELASFEAVATSGASVTLRWTTASEEGNLGFHLLRSDGADAPRRQVSPEMIPGAGTCAAPTSYEYVDRVPGPGTYRYWLEQLDVGGTKTTYGPALALVKPHVVAMRGPRPNPARREVQITMQIPDDPSTPARLALHDLGGREVIMLRDDLAVGIHEITWVIPERIASGAYQLVVRHGHGVATQALIIK